jgi:hypothetical protein
VTPKTGDGINPAVNTVPGQVVAAVRHPAIGVGLIFNRGLQLRADNMTVIAKTLLVTHIADTGTPTRHVAVLVRKVNGVVVPLKDNAVVLSLMAFRAQFVSAHLVGVRQRNGIPLLKNGAGEKDIEAKTQPRTEGTYSLHGYPFSLKNKQVSEKHCGSLRLL